MTKQLRIAIVGFGMAGATTAAALARRGYEADVFEQAKAVREVGAGLGLWVNAARLLKRLGLGSDLERVGCAARESAIFTPTGDLIQRIQATSSDGTSGYTIHRAELLDAIAQRVSRERLHLDMRCTGVHERDDAVRLDFADGSSAEFDVVLGADGLRSVVHDTVTEPSPPRFANLVAHRGLAPNTPDLALDNGRVWTDRKKYVIIFPVSGGRRINFAGFMPVEGMPEESWFTRGDKAEIEAEFAGWHPYLLRVIEVLPETFRWGLYVRDPLPRIVSRRTALVGDAAHPMTPHLGMGAVQAIEDAFALAVFLEGASPAQVPERLQLYQRLRLPRVHMVQELTRRNAQFTHAAFPLKPGEERPSTLAPTQALIDYDAEREAEKMLESNSG